MFLTNTNIVFDNEFMKILITKLHNSYQQKSTAELYSTVLFYQFKTYCYNTTTFAVYRMD